MHKKLEDLAILLEIETHRSDTASWLDCGEDDKQWIVMFICLLGGAVEAHLNHDYSNTPGCGACLASFVFGFICQPRVE